MAVKITYKSSDIKSTTFINDNKSNVSTFGIIGKVLLIFFLVMLLIGLSRNLMLKSSISFTNFLEFASNFDKNTVFDLTNFNINIFTITANWGVFDFLRIFINGFGVTLGVLTFVGAGLINCVTIIGSLFSFFFG